MPDVICLGELLIDLVSTTTDLPLADCPAFQKVPGGAPANVAVALARLGIDTGFVGKVGDDPFGALLIRTLQEVGVDTSRLMTGRRVRTSLAFVARRSDGTKDLAFWRHPGADLLLTVDELDFSYLLSASVFHFGSVSLSHFPVREATLAAAHRAHESGLLVSYDPNVRLPLWDSAEEARTWIWHAMKFAQVVKLAAEEWEFVTGTTDFLEGARKVRAEGPLLVVQTRGEDGCAFATDAVHDEVPGFSVNTVDSLGAGDAFVAAMLHGLMGLRADQPPGFLATLAGEQLTTVFRFANAAGALTTTRVGAIPAMPEALSIRRMLAT